MKIFKFLFKSKYIKQASSLSNLIKFNSFNIKHFCSTNSNTYNQSNLDKVKEKVLKLSLLNVNQYGWSEDAIKHASNELGYSNVYILRSLIKRLNLSLNT